MHRPVQIHAWRGDVESQQLAFAHLLDAADRAGLTIDLDHVEVIGRPGRAARLAHYLGELPGLTDAAGDAAAIVLMFPEAAGAAPPFQDTTHLTYLGVFDGRVVRPDAEA